MPSSPNGTLTKNTSRQSTSDSSPPMIRPRKLPASAATWLMPSAKPRWLEGNASVRIAVELANSIAPPTPWTMRKTISHSAPWPPDSGSSPRASEPSGEDDEAEVVDAHPAVHVAQPAERDDEHRAWPAGSP